MWLVVEALKDPMVCLLMLFNLCGSFMVPAFAQGARTVK